MFKPHQQTYPVTLPKVAAMKQFIQMKTLEPLSPQVKTTVQGFGNDLTSMNSLVQQINQVRLT